MNQLPSKEIINKAFQTIEWDYGNEVLYTLCRENFKHNEDDKIIAKVWLIGRAYSAAIERRKNKIDINDDFYIKKVIPALRDSSIDEYLVQLKSERRNC